MSQEDFSGLLYAKPRELIDWKRYSVPLDSEGYSISFNVNEVEAARDFFTIHGYVVYHDVLTPEECERSISAIFDIMDKAPGFNRNDRSTWGNWPNKSIQKYGSPQIEPVFETQLVRNRQNASVVQAFQNLLQERELLVNHDRCCFFRPTTLDPRYATTHNVHLDTNPWQWVNPNAELRSELENMTYEQPSHFIAENNQPCIDDGLQLQGVINFLPNRTEDGGYITVPGFHHHYREYFGPKCPIKPHQLPSHSFQSKDLIFQRAQRIPMKPGSIVVWDQRMPHGSAPNYSDTPRMAQFLKIFPTRIVSPQRYKERGAALMQQMRNALMNPYNQLIISEVGKVVFGVNGWPKLQSWDPLFAIVRNLQENKIEDNNLNESNGQTTSEKPRKVRSRLQ